MLSPSENDEGAPRQESPSNVAATDSHQTTAVAARPRCTHCGHIMFSEVSIRAGAGEDCRRGRSKAMVA